MSTAAGWDDPASDPFPHEADPDAEYDLYRERVDRGEQCPDCRRTGAITKTVVFELPLFTCICGCAWLDFVTRPAMVAA